MDRLLNVTTGLSIILLVIVLVSVRRAHIRVEYSVSWLVAAGAMLLLSRSRPLLDAVRNLIGLPDAPLTLFLLSGGVFLLMFFRFSVIISHLRDDNIALAQRVLERDDHLDALKSEVFRELLTHMRRDPGVVEPALDLLLVSRHLERIGDHATNVAEDVIFIVSARDVRHHAGDTDHS